MPKRTNQRARLAGLREGFARIRFLLRNPQFKKDLIALRRLGDPLGWDEAIASPELAEEARKANERLEREGPGSLTLKVPKPDDSPVGSYSDLLRKWNLQWFPPSLLTGTRKLPGTYEAYDKAILQELKNRQQDPEPRMRYMWRPVVTAWEPFDRWERDIVESWDGLNEVIEVPAHLPRPGTVLNIQVDLRYPQDVIETEVKRAVGEAKQRRHQLEQQGLVPQRPQRLRLDKVDFYLKVYDKAEAGEPYRLIARSLKSRKSTVQCAHVAAKLLIGGSRSGNSPTRRIKFNQKKHLKECPTCKAADHWDQYCEGFKSWATSNLGVEFIPFEELRPDGTPRTH